MQKATSVLGTIFSTQQNDGGKIEVVKRQKIGLELCDRNEHEPEVNLRDFYSEMYNKVG